MRRGRTRAAVALGAIALGACSFNRGGRAGADGGESPDADLADAGRADAAADCETPLFVDIAVNGATEPLAPTEPYAHVLVGDTVTLDAAGSCVQRGPISYEWQVSPIDGTRETALPDLTSPSIEVYSEVAERSYTVRLTITDGDGLSTQKLIFAFRTHGWQTLDPPDSIDSKDVHFGGGALWVGTRDGAYRYDPDAGTFESLDQTWTFAADSFADEIREIWYDDDASYVWMGHKDAKAGVWRGTPSTKVIDFIKFDAIGALGAPTIVNDIGPGLPGVRVATDLGVTEAADSVSFTGKVAPTAVAVEAHATGGGEVWLGGRKLWNESAPMVDLDPFNAGGGDSKIQNMLVVADTGELWLASEDFGLGQADVTNGEINRVFTDADGLPVNKVRDVVADPDGSGDIWVATQNGVARLKRDRAVWVVMQTADGLADRTDLRAITVDPDARAFYAAGSKGLVYIRAP